MRYDKDAEMILVCGRRGSGKSTLTKGLLAARPKVVIFDPRREYVEGVGAVKVTTLHDLRNKMAAKWSAGFLFSYVPRSGREAEDLHRLCLFLISAQGPYDAGSDGRKMTLVIDEMALSYPVSSLPAELYGMTHVCNQGRHLGIEAIGVTQLPQGVSTIFRTNCRSTYALALEPEGRKWLERKVEGEGPAVLAALQPFEFMHMRDGKFECGGVERSGKIAIKTPFP